MAKETLLASKARQSLINIIFYYCFTMIEIIIASHFMMAMMKIINFNYLLSEG